MKAYALGLLSLQQTRGVYHVAWICVSCCSKVDDRETRLRPTYRCPGSECRGSKLDLRRRPQILKRRPGRVGAPRTQLPGANCAGFTRIPRDHSSISPNNQRRHPPTRRSPKFQCETFGARCCGKGTRNPLPAVDGNIQQDRFVTNPGGPGNEATCRPARCGRWCTCPSP